MKIRINGNVDSMLTDTAHVLEEADQEFDSAATSVNSTKLPAIYKLIDIPADTIGVDFGGGKFDNAINYVKDLGATLCVYDPYNRSKEYNTETLRVLREHGGADWAVNSNVLNVIKEPEARAAVLRNIKKITKSGAPIYITVYEGSRSGEGAKTRSGYQLNRATADYLEEIQAVFPDAVRRGKLITAHNVDNSASSSVKSSSIVASASQLADIKQQLKDAALDCMVDFGFTDNEASDYIVVEVVKGRSADEIRAEVRAELEFDELSELIERLDPIVAQYGDGYFEPVSPGIAECYIQLNAPVNKASTKYTVRQTATRGSATYRILSTDVQMFGDEDDAEDLQRLWKFQVSKICPYDDADYYYAVGANGVIKYCKSGKVITRNYYEDADMLGLANTEWMQAVIDDVLDVLDDMNREIEPKMVYSSVAVEGRRRWSYSSFEPPEDDNTVDWEDVVICELSLDGVKISMDGDGYYEYSNLNFIESILDDPEGLSTDMYNIRVRDVSDIVSDVDDLLDSLLPTKAGIYALYGDIKLVYDVSGVQLYIHSYDLDDYDVTVNSEDVDVSLDRTSSAVANFKCEPCDE